MTWVRLIQEFVDQRAKTLDHYSNEMVRNLKSKMKKLITNLFFWPVLLTRFLTVWWLFFDHFWNVSGPFLNPFLTLFLIQFSVNFWTIPGPFLDRFWTNSGLKSYLPGGGMKLEQKGFFVRSPPNCCGGCSLKLATNGLLLTPGWLTRDKSERIFFLN